MFKVTFVYDETNRKWDPVVSGATSQLEAIQGFNAVVLTCQELDPNILMEAKTEYTQDGDVRIIPAVWRKT